MALRYGIAVHGGAGHDEKYTDGCEKAAQIGLAKLKEGADALTAALAAAVAMEEDPRFNAGRGSSLGLDGRTIEMDAGLMDTRGKVAGLAGIQRVRNPILVCRRLADTPMRYIVGEGATRFARAAGFEDFYEVSDDARSQHEETVKALQAKTGGDFPDHWYDFDYETFWPYQASWSEILKQYGSGTIGVVTLDQEGHMAVCSSTGGSVPMLLGRVGNTSLVGSGYYAGPAAAITASGVGEYIIERMLCRTAYEWVSNGMPLQDALDRAVTLVPEDIDVGLIGITREAVATSHNCPMPRCTSVEVFSVESARNSSPR